MENLKNLEKIAKIFQPQNIITSEEIDQVLKGIMEILASYKKGTDAINEETKAVVNILLDKVVQSNKQTLDKAETVLDGRMSDLETLLKDVKQMINDVEEIASNVRDGKDADEEKIVEDVVNRIKIDPTVVTLSAEEVRDKLSSLKDDARLDKSAIKGLEKVLQQKDLDYAVATLQHQASFLINKGGLRNVTAGTNVTIDYTDPSNPVISATGGSGSGDVTGPASSTDNAIARFDGTTGKIIQNSTSTLDDSGILSTTSAIITGTNGDGHIDLRHQASDASATGQSTALFADSNGDIKYKNDGNYYTTLKTSTNTADRVYTFPDATGTVALTSTLSGYVPYTGATTNLDLGNFNATALRLNTTGNVSSTSWTTTGLLINTTAATLTDSSGSGTIATRTASSFGIPTFASSNSTTLTEATTLYLGTPVAGSNTTITRNHSLITTGNVKVGGVMALGGTSVDTNIILTTSSNANDPAAAQVGGNFSRTLLLTATNSQNITGGVFNVSTGANNFNHTGIIRGGYFTAQNSNTATVSDVRGSNTLVYNIGTGTVTTAYGNKTDLQNLTTGTIGTLFGMHVSLAFNNGTITNTYAYYIGDITSGTQTNQAWGFYNSDTNSRNFFAGKTGMGGATPTAVLHLGAGTASANTAPLKFTSGTLNTTAEAGAVEFLTDNYYATITTGAARKGIVLDDGTALTSGRVPFATTNGRLTDDADFTFATDTLTVTKLGSTTLSGTMTLAENSSIALDPAGSADGKYTGITVTGTSDYTQAFGDLVYLKSSNSRWAAADADAASTAGPVALAMVVVAGTSGNACTLLLQGIIRADAKFPTMTIGATQYVGETAGAIQGTIPTGADNIIRTVGYALTADELYFCPSTDWQVTVA